MKEKFKIVLTFLMHQILGIWLLHFAVKSIMRHIRFFREWHPEMDEETLMNRVSENFANDLDNLRRSLGIQDRP